MNEHRTTSILQRVPVILAVTASSYGLPLESRAHRAEGSRMHDPASGRTAARAVERAKREALLPQD
jgi:hypothetical protein